MFSKPIIIFLMVSILLLISCSSSKEEDNQPSVKVTNHSVSCWLNLMPGSKGKFYVNGSLQIKNLSDKKLNSIEFKNISVYYSKNRIYSFKPVTGNSAVAEDLSLNPGEEKEFRFGMDDGLKIDERLMEADSVNLKIDIDYDDSDYIYEINNVNVERAY